MQSWAETARDLKSIDEQLPMGARGHLIRLLNWGMVQTKTQAVNNVKGDNTIDRPFYREGQDACPRSDAPRSLN